MLFRQVTESACFASNHGAMLAAVRNSCNRRYWSNNHPFFLWLRCLRPIRIIVINNLLHGAAVVKVDISGARVYFWAEMLRMCNTP